MNKETLQKFRYLMPGIILFFLLFPLFHEEQGMLDLKISNEDYLYILVIYSIGGLYYIIDLRRNPMNICLRKVDENIKNKLLEPYIDDPKIKDSINDLRKGETLLNIFYHILDQDASLKERMKDVYFNGLIVSSLIDMIIICPICAVIYYIIYFFTENLHYMFYIDISFLILSIIYLPLVISKHYRLSDNQLTYIVKFCNKELRKHLIDVN